MGWGWGRRVVAIAYDQLCRVLEGPCLQLLDARAAKEALAMYCSTVRATLAACNGYECQEKDGVFTLAFYEPGASWWRGLGAHEPSCTISSAGCGQGVA